MGGAYIFVALVLAALPVILLGKWFARCHLLGGRTRTDLRQLYETDVKPLEIEYTVFMKTYSALAEAFSIDIGLIRPNDKLENYSKMDEWNLGEGAEKMGRWLSDEVGRSSFDSKLVTVLDVLRFVQCHQL
jgi:hypothetical protein